MVRLGFICEGDCEEIFLESENFTQTLNKFGLLKVKVIPADGNGNLLPHNIDIFRRRLMDAGVDKIFILTDLDQDACITQPKKRIDASSEDLVIISSKAIEAWFLSDSQTLSLLIRQESHFEFPELPLNPHEAAKDFFLKHTGAGCGGKLSFARKVIRNGFSLEAAAAHPNCPSARYFLTKLTALTA